MIARVFGPVGLLLLVFVVVTQACDTPPKVPTASAVSRAIDRARNATDKPCGDARMYCAVYNDAVRAGLLQADDRADVSCAGVTTACDLAGFAGAPDGG